MDAFSFFALLLAAVSSFLMARFFVCALINARNMRALNARIDEYKRAIEAAHRRIT